MSNENVDIKVFQANGAIDEQRVVEIIRSQVLPATDADFHRVDVKVEQKDGSPKYLVAYLLRKDTYVSDKVRLDLSSDNQVTKTSWDYDDSDDDDE